MSLSEKCTQLLQVPLQICRLQPHQWQCKTRMSRKILLDLGFNPKASCSALVSLHAASKEQEDQSGPWRGSGQVRNALPPVVSSPLVIPLSFPFSDFCVHECLPPLLLVCAAPLPFLSCSTLHLSCLAAPHPFCPARLLSFAFVC